MKKYCLVAFAALFFVFSCTKELQSSDSSSFSQQNGNVYSFTFAAPAGDSKITLGDFVDSLSQYKMKWQLGDVLQVYEIGEGSTRTWKCATDSLTQINPDGSATFTFTIEAEKGTKLRLQQNNNMNDDKTYGTSILQYSQTYSGTGAANLVELRDYDMNYIDRELTLGTPASSGTTFRRTLAMVRIPFSSTVYKGWNVDKVLIARADSAQIAGQFGINGATSPEKSFIKINETNDASDFVEVKFSNPVTVSETEQNVFALTFPTYKYVAGQETPDVIYKVGFQISKDGQRKVLTAKFKTCLVSGKVTPLKFGTMVATDEDNDYYSQYKLGADLKIGDLVVNKKTYPTAALKQLSEIDYSVLNAGGLIFVDDKACGIRDLHTGLATNKTIASTKELVLIGRYNQSQKQSSLEVLEMRCCGDVAMLNLKLKAVLTGSSSSSLMHIFSKNSYDTKVTALRLQDCVVDGNICTNAVVGDRSGKTEKGTTTCSAPYSKICFDNCVVFLPVKDSTTGTAYPFYRHYEFFNILGGEDIERTLTLNNNEFIWKCSIKGDNATLINLKNDSDSVKHGSSPKLKFNVTNNNIINFSPSAVVRFKNDASFDAGSRFDRNVLFIKDNTLCTFSQAKIFYCSTSGKQLGSSKDNYVSALNCFKTDKKTKMTLSMYSSKVKDNNKLVSDPGINPFTTMNLSTGYVVVDAANTDISSRKAGATPKSFVAQE